MSRPRFLADEDLRRSIVRAIRRLEPALAITTVVEEGLFSVSDEQVLDYAEDGRWLLISHDVNSMKAAAEMRIQKGRTIPGLFLVQQSQSTLRVAESIVLVWSASEYEEWQDRIVYLPL